MSALCGANETKVPALQADGSAVLSGLTDSTTVVVVVQNSLETTRYLPTHVWNDSTNGRCPLLQGHLHKDTSPSQYVC